MSELFDLSGLLDPDENNIELEGNENPLDKSNTIKSVKDKEGVQDLDKEKETILDESELIDPSEIFDIDDPETEEKLKEKHKIQTDVPKAPATLLQTFTKQLIDEGVLEGDEEALKTIKSFDDIKALVADTISKKEFSSLNDEQKQYLDLIKAGVPHNIASQFQVNLNNLSSIDKDKLPQDEETSELLYKTLLETKGFTADKVNKYIQRSKETYSLGEDAQDALDELIALEKSNIDKIKAKTLEDKKAREDALKANLDKLKTTLAKEDLEIIKGVKVTPIESNKILESITKPTTVDENGKPIDPIQKLAKEDPVGFKVKLHYFFHKGFFNKNADFNFLSNIKKSKDLNNFEKELMKNQDPTFTSGNQNAGNPREVDNSTINAILSL